jgi:hypothetical protein
MTEARPAPLQASHACQRLKFRKKQKGPCRLAWHPACTSVRHLGAEIIANYRCCSADRRNRELIDAYAKATELTDVPSPMPSFALN